MTRNAWVKVYCEEFCRLTGGVLEMSIENLDTPQSNFNEQNPMSAYSGFQTTRTESKIPFSTL